MKCLPLDGIRVLDLGMVWAGAIASKFLGDMGAEVIKVEGGKRPDSSRGSWPSSLYTVYADNDPGQDPWNRTNLYLERNRNKQSLILDLTHPRGVDTLLRVVNVSDVVMENFRGGVMERLGLGYETLRQTRSDIIMISMSSQGTTGPESRYGSYGNILEQTAGVASITGYPGSTPRSLGIQYPDPLTGGISPGLVIAALRYRRLTGEGMHIDLSQRELATCAIGETFMDYAMNGRVWEPLGNQDRHSAPQGCYPCRGDDHWVTISIREDREWLALCRIIGRPDLTDHPRFATGQERLLHRDEVDQIISEWTSTQYADPLMHRLQQAGVPAGAVLDGREFLEDPHLRARGFWEIVNQNGAGIRRHMGAPFGFTRTPARTRSRAPMFGEHNRNILEQLLGLQATEIESLEIDGVLEYKPHWATDLENATHGPPPNMLSS